MQFWGRNMRSCTVCHRTDPWLDDPGIGDVKPRYIRGAIITVAIYPMSDTESLQTYGLDPSVAWTGITHAENLAVGDILEDGSGNKFRIISAKRFDTGTSLDLESGVTYG